MYPKKESWTEHRKSVPHVYIFDSIMQYCIGCNVPIHLWSTDILNKGWCPYHGCVSGAESVGYDKPLTHNRAKRSLKTCNLCGHYKDHGFYKENHMQNKCNLDDLPIREKFQGYCSCAHCEVTANLSGQEKKKNFEEHNYMTPQLECCYMP
jgi:hypothetical protein